MKPRVHERTTVGIDRREKRKFLELLVTHRIFLYVLTASLYFHGIAMFNRDILYWKFNFTQNAIKIQIASQIITYMTHLVRHKKVVV